MSLSHLQDYDWTSAAKSAAQVVDDQAVEKAFADQAYGFVANKVGILMQDPYQVGFEIVSKNDANTRMVGIFAFRVNSSLLYVPAFFLNGEIKGTDLLYRVDVKKFVNNNEEWITFLREHGSRDIGKGVSHDISRRIPYRMHMERLVSPPYMKTASDGSQELMANRGDGTWQAMEPLYGMNHVKVASDGVSWEPTLREMFSEGTVKYAADLTAFMADFGRPEHLEKIAQMVEKSPAFADAFVRNLQDSDFAPQAMFDRWEKEASQTKQASSEDLVLYRGLHDDLIKSAKAGEIYDKGYLIDDKRPEDVLSLVVADPHECLTQINGPGIYKVLMSDGTMKKALVGTQSNTYPGDCCAKAVPCGGSNSSTGPAPQLPKYVLMLTGTKFLHSMHGYDDMPSIWGSPSPDDDKRELEDPALLTEMTAGKGYVQYSQRDGTISDYFRVTGKKTRKGITEYEIKPRYHSNPVIVTFNPELAETDVARGLLGADSRFVEVADEKDEMSCCPPGGRDSTSWSPKNPTQKLADDSLILSRRWKPEGTKQASVKFMPNVDEFVLTMDGKVTQRMNRMETAVKMAAELRIQAASAEEILDEAKEKGQSHFFLMAKDAAALTMTHDPVFNDDYDAVFGTRVQRPERLAIPTQYIGEQVPGNRIGDAWNPTNQGINSDQDREHVPTEMLMNSSPEEIAQYAETHETNSVFPHGVLGSLLQTYDSSSAIDQYIPKMEDGLDAVGRSLFLFYWKPTDFQQSYGADDMRNLEDKLLSTFKQYGDTVLDLLRKTRRRKAGQSL